ncbi:MAG: SLOG family protein [Betaproteobacteria bacterium]
MKVAVCAGRRYLDRAKMESVLAAVLASNPGMVLMHSAAAYGGEGAGVFAWKHGLQCLVYPDDPLAMLNAKPKILIAFSGTPQAFIDEAIRRKLEVITPL